MDLVPYLTGGSAILALLLGAYFYKVVKAADVGTPKMAEIMAAIQQGSTGVFAPGIHLGSQLRGAHGDTDPGLFRLGPAVGARWPMWVAQCYRRLLAGPA